MAYEPKEWVCGETITAEALNHLENGVANCGGGGELLVVRFSNSVDSVSPFGDYTCDTAITTIKDAIDNGTPVIALVDMYMGGQKNLSLTTTVSFVAGSYRVDTSNEFNGNNIYKGGDGGWSELYTWQLNQSS